MTTTETTTVPAFYAGTLTSWMKGRDSYGRTTQSLYATHRGQWGTVAVVVTMPKAWVESHGDDRYLVSDWRREMQASRPEPRYFRSLADAKAYAEGLVRPLTEAELEALAAYDKAVQAEPDANLITKWASMHHASMTNRASDLDQLHTVMHRICTTELNRRTR